MFSVLDISSNADNNEFNTCISTDTFPTSENQSRGQVSSVSDEIIKLIPSVLNELAKVFYRSFIEPILKRGVIKWKSTA